MLTLIGGTLATLGFLGNALLIAVLFLLISGALSSVLEELIIKLCEVYERVRTLYYKIRLMVNPKNKVVEDKYNRSRLAIEIWKMQIYLDLLTRQYGSFEVCPICHFPHRPDVYKCSYCAYEYPDKQLDTSADTAYKLIMGK